MKIENFFKKLFLIPLSILVVVPVMSCASNASSDNSSTSDTATNNNTENYTTDQMVDNGTNEEEMSSNQTNTQNSKATTALEEFQYYVSVVDGDAVLTEGLTLYESRISEVSQGYLNDNLSYVSTLADVSTTANVYRSFWLLTAQAYKDANFEYAFVTKEQYLTSYRTSFETLKQTELSGASENYSYSYFIYTAYALSFWGDILMEEYLLKRTTSDFTVYDDTQWFQTNVKGNLKTEVDKYDVIYQALVN